ncbi:hypothetical protein [Lentibacillus sp. Marseille-P4043]|uniref:hypothetical protein n=1 Tax=Lentibacillus sp. Marseille-P4043 TaxID=2040293 RepID=UPI000D0B1F0A|nr:hypothetical protein [Lentibacillus sp. Marseille-P4043]
MTATTQLKGHKIEFLNGEWVFSDKKEPTVTTWENRLCGHCGLNNTPEGHDGCLGTLPGVMNACCGHGQTNEAYVQFLDRHCVRGNDALAIMDILKGESH